MKSLSIIVNRNLPKETNDLCRKIKKYNKTDIFVIESGSNPNKLSNFTKLYINDKRTIQKGLRFYIAINLALHDLYKSGDLFKYEYFFLSPNDAIVPKKNFLKR